MESTFKAIKENHIFLLFLSIFSFIHLTGDHVFNKTNTLKLAILFTGLSAFTLYNIARKKNLTPKYLLLLALPILTTLPGLLLHDGKYNYNLTYELSTLILCSIWAYFIFQYKSIFSSRKFINLFIPITIFVLFVGLIEKIGLSPLTQLNINPFEASWSEATFIYTGIPERIESTFGNINYYAGYLIQLFPVFLVFTFLSKQNHQSINSTIALTFISALLLLSLLFTGTRAALFSSLFSLIILALGLLLIHNKLTLKPLIYTGFLALCLTIVIVLFHQQRIEALLNYNAWHSRIVPWEASINSIKESPILGYGIGSSYQLFFEFVEPSGRLGLGEYSYNHVHFEILEIAQEGGIAGIIGYLFFWGYIFYSLIKVITNHSATTEHRQIALGITAGLIALHMHGCFSVAPRMIAVKIVTYTLAAYSLILIENYNTEKTKPNYSKIPIALISVTLILISTWLLPYLKSQYNYANALANDAATALKPISTSSDDIYTLDKSAWLAKENSDTAWLKQTLVQSNKIFPQYRKNPYLNSYLALLEDGLIHSKRTAIQAQERDIYLDELNELLAYIALTTSDKDLFIKQFSIALKTIQCRKFKHNCEQAQLKTVWADTPSPINSFKRQNDEVFILSNSLFNLIKNANFETIKKNFNRSLYFQPQALEGSRISPSDWGKIYRLLKLSYLLKIQKQIFHQELISRPLKTTSLLRKITDYHHYKVLHEQRIESIGSEISDIKSHLSLKIDVDSFLKRRKIYNYTINWFARVLAYNESI